MTDSDGDGGAAEMAEVTTAPQEYEEEEEAEEAEAEEAEQEQEQEQEQEPEQEQEQEQEQEPAQGQTNTKSTSDDGDSDGDGDGDWTARCCCGKLARPCCACWRQKLTRVHRLIILAVLLTLAVVGVILLVASVGEFPTYDSDEAALDAFADIIDGMGDTASTLKATDVETLHTFFNTFEDGVEPFEYEWSKDDYTSYIESQNVDTEAFDMMDINSNDVLTVGEVMAYLAAVAACPVGKVALEQTLNREVIDEYTAAAVPFTPDAKWYSHAAHLYLTQWKGYSGYPAGTVTKAQFCAGQAAIIFDGMNEEDETISFDEFEGVLEGDGMQYMLDTGIFDGACTVTKATAAGTPDAALSAVSRARRLGEDTKAGFDCKGSGTVAMDSIVACKPVAGTAAEKLARKKSRGRKCAQAIAQGACAANCICDKFQVCSKDQLTILKAAKVASIAANAAAAAAPAPAPAPGR